LQQPEDVTVDAGQPASLCAAFGGTSPFSVSLNRWSNAEWTPVGSRVSFTDNAPHCISTPNLEAADNGAQFKFLANNAEGGPSDVMTRTAIVTVRTPSAIPGATLVSRGTDGAMANHRSGGPSISADGNVIAFYSDATNFAPGVRYPHGYVRNLVTGVTTLVDQLPNGGESNAGISQMKLSGDGQHVVFSTLANGMTPDDNNDARDVFVRDLQTGSVERVTVLADGSQLLRDAFINGNMRLDISHDGRFVIFAYNYDFSNLGAEMDQLSLFVRDMQSKVTRIVMAESSYSIEAAALSSNGSSVAYTVSLAYPNPAVVKVYDVGTGQTQTAFTLTRSSGADYLGSGLSISGDGSRVSFALRSQSLLVSTYPQIVVVDRNDPNTLIVASTGSAGSGIGMADGITTSYPKLSYDGRQVMFSTTAPNITGGVANPMAFAVVVRDLQAQKTEVASRNADGYAVQTKGNSDDWHAISGNGNTVAFVASPGDMGDGVAENQVYAGPRP